MTIQLGQIAPDFAQDSSAGRIRFHYWLGDSWGVLFSHAQDDAGAGPLVTRFYDALKGAGYKPEVSVATAMESGHVIIRVKDNGVGIPDAIKEKIMQPFFTTKPTGEGTGLGLPLVRSFVALHGGDVSIKSALGMGTTVSVWFPRSRCMHVAEALSA